jgi:hypothetical protein
MKAMLVQYAAIKLDKNTKPGAPNFSDNSIVLDKLKNDILEHRNKGQSKTIDNGNSGLEETFVRLMKWGGEALS